MCIILSPSIDVPHWTNLIRRRVNERCCRISTPHYRFRCARNPLIQSLPFIHSLSYSSQAEFVTALRTEACTMAPSRTETPEQHAATAASTTNSRAHLQLKSKWPEALDLQGSNLPCRLEGEVADLVVLGTIPPEIDGTFYRVMTDPFMPPHPGNVPLDGDGNISALRFKEGRVDFKMRYVETERLKLERHAGKAMFGLYRNPFTHHPCVRAAVDSTANTNVVLWADKFLALKEGGLPYQVDPHTLETIRYDPFGEQGIKSKTFTAHPKIDPSTDELVVFGYEAKGLATTDIVIYALDKNGRKRDEQWIKAPWCGPIHDCAITPNWLILSQWPFDANVERMKKGGHHWAWNYSRAATFIVVPRRKSTRLPAGWEEGECRVYHHKNEMLIHTAGAWESEDGSTLWVETTRVRSQRGSLGGTVSRAEAVYWGCLLSAK